MPRKGYLRPFAEVFDRYVSIQLDTCWHWIGSRSSDGYGSIGRAGKTVGAHRFVYENLVGPIPIGLQLDHLCRVPSCVNPHHLEPVTAKENVRRGNAGGGHQLLKTHCPRGHEYTEQNTYRNRNRAGGISRSCKVCVRILNQGYREKRKNNGPL